MNKEFRLVELQDLAISITDCHHSTPRYTESGKLVVRNYNIKKGRFLFENLSYTDQEQFEHRIARAKPEPGDLIITREAPMGEVCIIPDDLDCCLGQRMVLIKPDPEKVDNKFLLYSLLSNYCQTQINKSEGTGSIVSNLRIPVLKELHIPYLPLYNQQKITSILSAIDDKIELNNKINTELEGMAKLIYDYWFVQFDFPYDFSQGKPAGETSNPKDVRPYKSSGGKMVWNKELKREVPEGWGVKCLYEISNIRMGQSPEGSSYNEEGNGLIFFQGSTDFGWRFPEIRVYTTAPTRFASKGDILLSVRAPIGTMNVSLFDCSIGRGLAALNSKEGYNSFLIYQMNYFKKKFDYLNLVGTTFGSLTKDDLYNLKLIYPPKEILQKFEEAVTSYDKKIENNTLENQELSALRDWLLPMLMNGQVRVDIEKSKL